MRADSGQRSDAAAAGPLAGIRIVEFAGIGPGPFAGMLLSDMGADVVRVVRPGAPEVQADDFVNRGRVSVELDLKSESDRERALQLLAHADALIEGFRPKVMERNGLAPVAVFGVNPRLVYGRMTGWGQSGPLAQRAGHDINYISLTGALAAIGTRDIPVPPLNLVGDYGGGSLYLVVGMLAALLQAKISGKGQVVDAAMCDGTLSLLTPLFSLLQQGHWTTERQSNLLDGGAHFYGVYTCLDGKHVAVGPIEPQFYAILREKLELEDALFDRQLDASQWPELRKRLERVFLKRTRDEWCEMFNGTDGCVTPVLSFEEASSHPHLAARESFVFHNGFGQPAPAPRFSHTPSVIQASRGTVDLEEIFQRWKES